MRMRPLFMLRTAWRVLRVLARLAWLYPAAAIAYASGRKEERADEDPLLVFHSQVAWRGAWQRPHEIAMGLARDRRVLYLAPIMAHERLDRYAGTPIEEPVEVGRELTVFSPEYLPGDFRWEWVFRLNRLILVAETRWRLRREGPVILMSNTPFGAPLLTTVRLRAVVYDMMDDFTAFSWAPRCGRRMERRFLGLASIVFTGTYTVQQKASEQREDAMFVPCGVHFNRFHDPGEDDEPEDLAGLGRPMIGYAGTLAERVDSELIQKLAEAAPEAAIVLIGPEYNSLRPRPQAPNIHYLGLKKHEDLPAYMRRFKVGLLPFRQTPSARAVNPVKTLEYFAAGAIVVSTSIPDVERFYSDIVLTAYSHDEFINLTCEALNGIHDDRIEKGVNRARESTWQAMVETMDGALRNRGL